MQRLSSALWNTLQRNSAFRRRSKAPTLSSMKAFKGYPALEMLAEVQEAKAISQELAKLRKSGCSAMD